mmetsp:Transcript_56072/g.102821  ORF Transcript_56072/g.102821 Transcript_56072/m.102821 type:complete len:573 (-) Transcript_56072:177-1895(-)
MCSTGAACCATQGALAAMSPGAPKAACQFGEVLAALAVSPEVDTAVPAVWPATPTPELCHATVRSSASMLMFSLPGLDCLAPVFESKLPPQVAESTACNRTHDTGTMKAISPSDKPSPTALPTILAEAVLAEEDTCRVCTVCHDTFSMSADCQDAMDCFSVDGRPTCQTCRHLFDAVPFVPKTEVCINPLCRRKWKQLTPKVLPHFCLPCMRHLEEGIPAEQSDLEIAPVEFMYDRWYNIYAEIAETVGYPAATSKVVKRTEAFESGEPARQHWQTILAAFGESFKSPPPSEEVRNWNSVYGRRKHYRGVVRRRNQRHCVSVEALEELSADLTPIRRVTSGVQKFLLVDWQHQLIEGQEVHFIACPNPSVEERDAVGRIVGLLNVPRKAEEKCPSSPEALQAIGAATDGKRPISNADISKSYSMSSLGSTTLPSSPASTGIAFSDLMQWSQEELAEPEAPSAASGFKVPGATTTPSNENKCRSAAAVAAAQDVRPHPLRLSLDSCLLLDGKCALQQPPSTNLHVLPLVHPMSGVPAGTCDPMVLPLAAHAEAGPGCSPLMCPKSPCAAYFGD